MGMDSFEAEAELWIWHPETGKGSWHFLTISGDTAKAISDAAVINRLELGLPKKRGWGAVKVEAAIGDTVWQTSLFPLSKTGEFMLPVKAAVRKAEGVVVGDKLRVLLKLI
ncbi:DUF1905 domain-containing protein [Alterisphingorhabdus coralli]|uniref:DUF1905 domain-containing protein n=1 Tax=Alterisphingorhabdus coralli TaxID=3071408 RepID=A0AA97F7P6_9SPHN|nr:DUF1905 domain-containing protein [Parasphingorhabdus sp. SCSIO 66989]WOE75508.1 DUF1905 domain-containing protein [Parasphingorhabdus sp. SCSIO 66989]